MESNALGVYLHIPYCRVLCPYCDFVKKRTTGSAPVEFTDALCTEIEAYDGPSQAQSFFLGGGTPSLLTPECFHRTFDALRSRFSLVENPEIGIEVNPDDVTNTLIEAWLRAGVNRISIGVQSFNDEVLAHLGRCHDAATARTACAMVGEAFENWGIDLIFGAPPLAAWQVDLEETLRLAPPHISAYGLTYEKGTPFWNRRGEAVEDDRSLDMYREAHAAFSNYDHYEISNFARDGFQSRHNAIYWRNGEYAAFGPGAVSYLKGIRARNTPSVSKYIEYPGKKIESLKLTNSEIQQETLIQHFRTRAGLDKETYKARFGKPVHAHFGVPLQALFSRGLLEEDETAIRPTTAGFELNDEIGLALVSDSSECRSMKD